MEAALALGKLYDPTEPANSNSTTTAMNGMVQPPVTSIRYPKSSGEIMPAKAEPKFIMPLAVLVVAWALGLAVTDARVPWLSREAGASQVLRKVNAMMPPVAMQVLDSFDDLVGSSFFPRYLEPFATERIPSAEVRILADSGHLYSTEQPEVDQEIAQFFRGAA